MSLSMSPLSRGCSAFLLLLELQVLQVLLCSEVYVEWVLLNWLVGLSSWSIPLTSCVLLSGCAAPLVLLFAVQVFFEFVV